MSWFYSILGPLIKGSSGVRTVKMDCGGSIILIHETNKCFSPLCHMKCWTRSDSIISHQICHSQVWIYLLLKRLDNYFIEVDRNVCGAVIIGTMPKRKKN